MTTTPKVLLASAFVANGAPALIYTAPALGKGVWLDVATALNDNAASQQLTIHIVPAAGAASAANQIVKNKAIAAAATDLLPELRGKFLNPGDMLYAGATAASAIALAINGRERTDA